MMSIYEEKNNFNVLMAGWYFPHAVMGVEECRYFGTYAVFWTASKDGSKARAMASTSIESSSSIATRFIARVLPMKWE